MVDDEAIKHLMVRLGADDSDKELITTLYEDATAVVLDFTHRDVLTGGMPTYAKQLAVVYFNRLDTEGESARTEGNVVRSFVTDIPESIQRPLRRYRVAKWSDL
ncbi:phage head-tail connector protein [Levilactobacillus acidifarinae]|uniref:Uncharacterized protein n=1 Tax=Levilactobacillus acidifarinae DSM 19394 = JCM 15949 TaxID=1423715 RepID=A0A0R1LF68_9LACO|nr:phage head-tail connector protein [Levilactobacillus acidifarinae]KRK94245.1 hypothetical protein FD25_GL000198 [Levilactobacillus acidifarinae DSM 19394]GEO70536.1 hypothetical protein LAC03_24460 [Levilactobacillus acidifarinae]